MTGAKANLQSGAGRHGAAPEEQSEGRSSSSKVRFALLAQLFTQGQVKASPNMLVTLATEPMLDCRNQVSKRGTMLSLCGCVGVTWEQPCWLRWWHVLALHHHLTTTRAQLGCVVN